MTSQKQIEDLEDVIEENKKATKELQNCLNKKLQQLQEVMEDEPEPAQEASN